MCRWFLIPLAIAHLAAQTARPGHDASNHEGAVVEGQVVNQRTEAPLAAAQIKLQSSQGALNQTATDRKGHFSFSGVEPGEYRVEVQRTGFVPLAPGKMVLTLAAGETVKDLTIRLTPQAVVSGTVLDADGVPVANVYVHVSRRSWRDGKRALVFSGGAQSNDAGEFRISALAAGDYLLCARPHELAVPPSGDPAGDKVKHIYVPTWHPGVADAGSAAALHLAAGEEHTGVAITLRSSAVVKVSGRVVQPKSDLSVAIVQLMGMDDADAMDTGGLAPANGPDGAFTIPNVPPGSYRIQAQLVDLRGGQQGAFGSRPSASQIIQVGDSDVEGITLAPAAAQSLSGVIQWDGKPPKDAGACIVSLHHDHTGDIAIAAQADGAFSLASVPQDRSELDVSCEAKGSYMKAARLGGADILEKGINGAEALPPGPLQVTMATGAGEIQGSVADADQHPVSGAKVVAVPEGSKRANLFRTATSDQNGHFKLSRVVPGAYSLYAWDQLEGDAWFRKSS